MYSQSAIYQQQVALLNNITSSNNSEVKRKFDELRKSSVRFNASRSFDIEDDVEFCPVITEEEIKRRRLNNSNGGTPYLNNTNLAYSSPFTLSNGLLVGNPVPTGANTSPHQHSQIPDYFSMNSAGSSSVSSMGSPVSRQTILGNSSGMLNGNVNQRNRQMMMVDGSGFQSNNNSINMSMGNMSGHGTSHSANRFIAPNGVADRSSVYFQNQR